MHLDLNLDIFTSAGESPAGELHKGDGIEAENPLEDSRIGSEEDSGTSSSSAITSSSSTTGSGFISFGILRKDEITPRPEFSEFPAISTAGEKGFVLDMSNGRKWLNLSSWVCDGGDKPETKRKSRRGPRSRSSPYRGVTFYRRTGRWESHIWDCGKQVYLGGFDTAHAAARAYDRAALKFRGMDADINFGASDYAEEMKQMKNLTKEEFVQVLRRQCNGGGGRNLYKYSKQWEAKPIQPPVARGELFETPEIGYASGFGTNVYGIRTSFGSSSSQGDMEQNLELSLGLFPRASRTAKAEPGGGIELSRNYMGIMEARCDNPALLVGIYPDILTNNQRVFEKRTKRDDDNNNNNNMGGCIREMGNGMNAASSRFSSSSASSSTGPYLPSSTRNDASFTTQVEDLKLYTQKDH